MQLSLELLSQLNNDGRLGQLAPQEILSVNKIERAQIANLTPIVYNPKELISIIHDHLTAVRSI